MIKEIEFPHNQLDFYGRFRYTKNKHDVNYKYSWYKFNNVIIHVNNLSNYDDIASKFGEVVNSGKLEKIYGE